MTGVEEDRDPFDWVHTMFEKLAGLSCVQKETKVQVYNWCERDRLGAVTVCSCTRGS